MTRAYAHRPDVAFAEAEYADAVDFVDGSEGLVARKGSIDTDATGVTLDVLWEGLAWGWLTEQPTAELRTLVVRATGVVRAWLDLPRGRPPVLRDVGEMLATVLLAGDLDAAARVAALDVGPSAHDDGEWSTVVLHALVRGEDTAAAEATDRWRAVVAAPTTAPVVAAGYAHLDELAAAVLRADQDAFDAALRARAVAVARLHRTQSARRDWTGVLDRTALALAVVGTLRGLTVPSGVDVVPAELLAATTGGA